MQYREFEPYLGQLSFFYGKKRVVLGIVDLSAVPASLMTHIHYSECNVAACEMI